MITKEDIEYELSKVLDPAVHDEWWTVPIYRYGRMTPVEIWINYGPEEVYELVKSYSDPSFT